MTGVEWHLDLIRCPDGSLLLAVWEPKSARLEREVVTRSGRMGIVRALDTILQRTFDFRPETIVTDNAISWSGVADALGLKHRFVMAGNTALERIARQLLANLADEA